jgi:hypothetical protein
VQAGGSKATLGLLRGELEQTKQLLTKTQSEMKQEVLETKQAGQLWDWPAQQAPRSIFFLNGAK